MESCLHLKTKMLSTIKCCLFALKYSYLFVLCNDNLESKLVGTSPRVPHVRSLVIVSGRWFEPTYERLFRRQNEHMGHVFPFGVQTKQKN
jgi:hypothetical protein